MSFRNGSKLLQFAHPIKKMPSFNTLDSFSPRATKRNQINVPQRLNNLLILSPKPLTPTHCKYQVSGSPLGSPSTVYNNVSHPYYMSESRFAKQHLGLHDHHDHIPVAAPPMLMMFRDESGKGSDDQNGGREEEEVEEIIKGIIELYERLPMNVRDQVTMAIMKGEMIKQKGYEASVHTRSIGGHVEDISHKLERFKIKTVMAGGPAEVVKGEDQKNKF